MDTDLEDPTIKILFLAEKDLSKRSFIDSFRKSLMYKSYAGYNNAVIRNQTNNSDTFNARYKKLCFIDTPEVDPNASLSANLAVIRSIKYSIHTSGHLNGIICLLHYEPKYYKNYLELIFTHLFTADILPKVTKKLLFIFYKGNEREEAVELSFSNFLKKYETDISDISWKNWPVPLVDVVYTKLDQENEDKWTESINFFQEIFEHIVGTKMDVVQLECRFSHESITKIVNNFLDVLTQIAFTIEDNIVAPATNYTSVGYNICAPAKNYNSRSVQTSNNVQLNFIQSNNYCISVCRSLKCTSKNMGICCECKLVSKPSDIKKCTSFMPPSNICTKCGCSITKHDAVPYKLGTRTVSSNDPIYNSIHENRRFVINTICALTVFKEEYDLSKIFKNRLQEKIDMDSRESSPYKNLIFLFEEAMNQFGEVKSEISINDIQKCIETAVEKSLISADYRNAFLSPDVELVACSCGEGGGDSGKRNFNLSKEDKHLEEKLNNLNV